MARRQSGAVVQARTRQLLERDPDHLALQQLPEPGARSEAQQRAGRDLESRLSLKYGAAVMPWPSQAGRPDYKTEAAEFKAHYIPPDDLNVWLKNNPTRALLTDTPIGPVDPLWATDPPRLRVMVRLDLITTHDIERLTAQFRQALRACLHQTGREEHALRWVRTVAPAVFNRAVRRYDLHRQEGLTFRQIAYLEREERRGRTLRPGQLRGVPVRIDPGAESSVRESVQRVYRSIYRVRYRAKRMSVGASNVMPYQCQTHPKGDCPKECPVLTDWCARLWPSLPKTGS